MVTPSNESSSLSIEIDSPKLKERALEAKVHLQELKLQNKKERADRHWDSCCLTMDKDFVQFIVQMTILGSTIAYSAVQLGLGKNDSVWGNIMVLCIGIVIPNPSIPV